MDASIVLRVFRVDRTTRRYRCVLKEANVARYPEHRATFKFTLLRPYRGVIKSVKRPPARRELRGSDEGLALNRLIVRVLYLRITTQDVFPIRVVRLCLCGIPVGFAAIVRLRNVIVSFSVSIRQPSRATSTSYFALLSGGVGRAIICMTFTRLLRTATAGRI